MSHVITSNRDIESASERKVVLYHEGFLLILNLLR